MTTEHDRDLLLAYLYGALEDADRNALEARLAAEPELRVALDGARDLQSVFGDAAGVSADDLKLTPPRRGGRLFTLRRLGQAAAVLAAVGLGVAGWRTTKHSALERLLPVFTASGPGSFVPGEPVLYSLQTTTLAGDGLPATVTAQIRGTDGWKDAGTAEIGPDGRGTLALDPPTDHPGQTYRVRLAAEIAGSAERKTVQHTVPLRDATRVATRVATDKPLYKPGETVRLRGVALESFRLTPAGDTRVRMRLEDPRGGTVFEHDLPTQTGVTGWEWEIPADAPGGRYRVVLGDGDDPNVTSSDRTFQVRSYRVPRLRFDTELDRDSYGPGAEGRAYLSVERLEGGVPEGASVEAVLHVDGVEAGRQTLALGGDGTLSVPFRLPGDITEGRAHLAVTVTDGGTVETTTKTVPVALGRLDVELFPEGGDLVAGVAQRVYFRARTPGGEPADLHAVLEDANGEAVAEAIVDVLGMGSFELTPRRGETYRLRAISPASVTLATTMPEIKANGAVLTALSERAAAGRPMPLRVVSTRGGRHTLAAWCRGGQIAETTVELRANVPQDVELAPTSAVGGVVRVTLTNDGGVPVAERLMARTPARRLTVTATPARPRVAPRERVEVQVTVVNAAGLPAANVILGASVVDEGVIALANDEDTASLPLHFLLGMEVDELERAELFEGGSDSDHAVDLLLGVQGWRRFAWKNVHTFLAEHPEAGRRVAAADALELTQSRSNAGSVERKVERRMRRVDRDIGGASLAGLFIVIFVGSLVIGIRGLWNRHLPSAIGGWTVVALFVAAPVMFSAMGSAPSAVMEAADGAAWENGAPEAEMRLANGLREAKALRVDAELAQLDVDAAELDALEQGQDRIAVLVQRREDRAKRQRNRPEGARPRDREQELKRLVNRLRLVEAGEVLADEDGEEDDDFAFVLLREYAHVAQTDGASRSDFAEVLYWNPLLITGADGTASFAFDTSDSISTFRVSLEGHDGRGALGASHALIESRVPFYVEPKFPVALSTGDRLDLPVIVANDTGIESTFLVTTTLGGALLESIDAATFDLTLAAGVRGRRIVALRTLPGVGDATIQLEGVGASGLTDTSRRTIAVESRGYPMTVARGGAVEKLDAATFELPDDLNRTTLTGSVKLYPSTLATLVDGLEGLLQSPGGCFEQASSTNYPNVLVLSYLQDQDAAAPEVARKAREMLDRGYTLLAGYECSERGYEWFGGNPGHEALTAYGLMEFVDMGAVHEVDDEMVERTRTWLLDRRDGDGGFRRNDRALDSFGSAPQELTDAYIVWALTEAGESNDITKEIETLYERARSSDDPYLVALAANALANRDDPRGDALIKRLSGLQREDGAFVGTQTSITSSSGVNLEIETTALAALALSRRPEHLARSESAIRFLITKRAGGRFGATQATVLALRALIAHARATRSTASDHDIEVLVNGDVVAREHVAAGSAGAIEFSYEILDAVRPGTNEIELRTTGEETLPWALTLGYHTQVPPTSPECKVEIVTELASATAIEGETLGLTITVRNRVDDGVPMTIARVGLPAGLEPRAEQLDELKKAGAFGFYELRSREITLYWRGLAPRAERVVELDLVAAIPGRFEGPATSAYLYYGDEHKHWTAPTQIEITAR